MGYDLTPGRLRGRKAVERRRLYLLRNPLCLICKREGKVTMATEVDHIIPLFKGGKDCYETNGQPICNHHHSIKSLEDMGYKKRVTIGEDGFPVDES
jgi:5-methylcytosine-specific restriction protein A